MRRLLEPDPPATARLMVNVVERLYDVGVAGIHSLLSKRDVFDRTSVVVVVAGLVWSAFRGRATPATHPSLFGGSIVLAAVGFHTLLEKRE